MSGVVPEFAGGDVERPKVADSNPASRSQTIPIEEKPYVVLTQDLDILEDPESELEAMEKEGHELLLKVSSSPVRRTLHNLLSIPGPYTSLKGWQVRMALVTLKEMFNNGDALADLGKQVTAMEEPIADILQAVGLDWGLPEVGEPAAGVQQEGNIETGEGNTRPEGDMLEAGLQQREGGAAAGGMDDRLHRMMRDVMSQQQSTGGVVAEIALASAEMLRKNSELVEEKSEMAAQHAELAARHAELAARHAELAQQVKGLLEREAARA